MNRDYDILDSLNYFMVAYSQSVYMGVDWAEGSGMNRGDIFKREENVIHVRFKTVTF